jgi:hypothetical protein
LVNSGASVNIPLFIIITFSIKLGKTTTSFTYVLMVLKTR